MTIFKPHGRIKIQVNNNLEIGNQKAKKWAKMQETYQLKFLKNVTCKNKIRALYEHKNSLEL